jgi:hypothetical protein
MSSRRKQTRRAKKTPNEEADNDAFYNDQYNEPLARTPASRLSENPIVAAVQRSLLRRAVKVTALCGHESPKEAMQQFLEVSLAVDPLTGGPRNP